MPPAKLLKPRETQIYRIIATRDKKIQRKETRLHAVHFNSTDINACLVCGDSMLGAVVT